MITMSPREIDRFERLVQSARPGLPAQTAQRLDSILLGLREHAGLEEGALQEMMRLLEPAPAQPMPHRESPYIRQRLADQAQRPSPAARAQQRLLRFLYILHQSLRNHPIKQTPGRRNTRQ